jgi:hypothetical protein
MLGTPGLCDPGEKETEVMHESRQLKVYLRVHVEIRVIGEKRRMVKEIGCDCGDDISRCGYSGVHNAI